MTIKFQSLQESHFPLLLKWLETPHVKVWWNPEVEWTLELIENKYRNYVKGFKRLEFQGCVIEKPIHAFLICIDDKEVGYIQYYNVYDFRREQRYEIEGLPDSLAALDIFIGKEEFLGKGLGCRIIKQFLSEYVDPHYDACFVDPDTANIRAIRTYENAGFKKIKMVKDGRITWMLRENI